MAPLGPLHPPSTQDGGAMPGERPRRAPPPTMTGDLQPCQAANGLGHPPQPPIEDHSPGARGAVSRAQAREPPEAQLRQATEIEAAALLLSTQAPAGRSRPHARVVGRADGSPTQLCGLSITSSRAKPTLDETPEGPPCQATQNPKAEGPRAQGTGAHHRPSLLGAKALPAPKERNSQRCFPEASSSLTSTDYTSTKATPGPLPLRAPQSSSTSPHGPASYPGFQARGSNTWPPAAANDFPGADFGVPPLEPEPFPEGSRPSSPQRGSFQFPFPARGPHGAGSKPLPADTAQQELADRARVFAFHQPAGTWQEAGMGTAATYPLPAGPAPTTLPCYPSQPGRLEDPRDPGGALSPTGAAHLAPSPLPDSLHKSLTTVLPDGAPSARDGMGSPRGLPNPRSQRHFPGQAYGANGVGTSPEPVDPELTTPGPPPTRPPQLWDPTAAPYPIPAMGPPDTARAAFLKGPPGPGQGLCLPQSSPVPWPQVLPSPHQMEILSQLPFPRGTPEWQGDSQAGLSAACQAARPGEALGIVRSSPGQPGSSPGLFPYSGRNDPGAQPLFFGGAQPQASPRGTPGLPPPRVVGASPSESPLPSPATTTAGSSTCSSLSPLSSSPANPGSEDSQLPGPLGPAAFFHPPPHPQETGSSFPSPEPPQVLRSRFQLEPAKAFAFPTDGLGAAGPQGGGGLLQGFPREPPPYPNHHFSLSSASLDQLDVLLTCRQCDRNYGSLAGFLAHRLFCRQARAGDGPQQAPGPPAPSTSPKAPTHTHIGPLSHSQTAPFLLARDDPLRTSYLPSLATPFLLPASDLDMEDEAKLDSLITEALNGMEYQSDNPEIDSSFIDVFTDEEPSGPRGPGAGLPTNNRPGTAPEPSAQDLLPAKADTPEPGAPCPGDGNRPKTRSLGLAPMEADATSLVRPQRRGKQFKLLRKELDTANGPKGPCLRPRKRGRGTERPPPRPRDLRTQAQGLTGPDGQAPETRSSRRLRLPPKKDPRRRRVRGGTWSKELIHKIVQQKNQLHRRPAQRGLSSQGPPPARSALPGPQGGMLGEGASESEEECPRPRAPGSRGRSRHDHKRWCQDRRREDDPPRGPRRGLRHEASEDGGSPAPVGEATVEQGHEHTEDPTASPKRPPQIAANSSPEESHLALDLPGKAPEPARAQESAPGAPELREGPSSSAAICIGESARPPVPEPTQPGRHGTHRPQPPGSGATGPPSQSTPAPGPREDCPADQPGGVRRPVATLPAPHILLVNNTAVGCDPPRSDRDPVGVPPARKEPLPNSRAASELLLGPRELQGGYPGGLGSEPSAAHAQRACSAHLCLDSMDTLEPKPLKHSPPAAEADPGSAPSPLTLESTSLFAGLPEDGFDQPLCHSQSTDGDTHTPLVQADSPPKTPLVDPPHASFLLLAQVSPMLPSRFPDPLGVKSLGEKCPHQGPAPPSLPPVPGKGREGGLSSLSEDDLEIQRLVTELESQLQREEGTAGAPGEPHAAAHTGSMGPAPGPGPASPPGDTVSAADLTDPGESNGRQEGMETAVATREGALGSFQGEWPCPGSAAPPPSTHKEPGSGAPLSPTGSSISLQAERKARVSETEGDGGDPCRQQQLLRVAPRSATSSPNQELLFLKINETVRTQGTEDTPLWLPCDQSGGCSPEHPKAERCPQGSPAWGAWGNPIAHLAPDLAIGADGDLPPGACHSPTSEGHCEGREGGPERAGLLPMTAGPGFEGQGMAPAGASGPSALQGREPRDPATPSPAWAPKASPSRRPRATASLCSQPLQVPRPRASSQESVQDSQGAPLAAVCGPLHRGPPGPGGQGVGKQVTAVPVAAGPQLGPEADGQLGSPGQAKRPEGCGEASQLRSVNWRDPGGPESLARLSVHPGNPLARPAGGSPELEGHQATLGLWKQTQPAPGPTSSGGAVSRPAPMVAHTQKGPEDKAPEKASSPGLDPRLLFNRESPAPHTGGLGTQDPTPTAMATPAPCSLQHLPGEDLPSTPSSGPGAQGRPRGRLLASAPCAQGLPSHSAWGHAGGAICVQAPTGAGAGGALAALPSLTTSHCGPQERPPGCPLLRASSPQDPPRCQPGLGAASAHTYRCCGPQDGTPGTLEDPKREGLGRPPAYHTHPAPGGASSPRAIAQAAGPSSIPTEGGTEAVRGLGVPDPHLRGAIYPQPFSVSEGPSSEPPSNTPLLVHGEGESPSSVPSDTTSPGATGPDPHGGPGGETGAGEEGKGDPGARHTGMRKLPRAGTRGPATTPPPTGLCEAQDSTSSSTARDLRSDSLQSQTSVLGQTPQKDPKQRPRGCKKKPVPTETGLQKRQPPAQPGPPATCEICSASFRSRPGLNRHKARKHQPGKVAPSQPHPVVHRARQAPDPTAQACRGSRKRSRKGPGGDRPSLSLTSPGHASGPSPVQGSTVPEDALGPEMLEEARRSPGEPRTPGSPPDQLPHPPGLVEQGEGVGASAPKSRRPALPEADQLHPKQTENREGQRQTAGPTGAPSSPEGRRNKKVGKLGARGDTSAPASADLGLHGRCWGPAVPITNHVAPLSCGLLPGGECEAGVGQTHRLVTLGPEVLKDEADTGLGVLCAETSRKSPRDQRLRQGKVEGTTEGLLPGELSVGRRGASARRSRGPRELRAAGMRREPEPTAGSQPAGDSRGAPGRSGKGTGEGSLDPPEASDSVVGSTTSPCPRGLPGAPGEVQGPQDTAPEAHSPALGDPPSLLDDEVSFSQLFPLGGRFTRKKNPRVYGKRCKRPKRPPPAAPLSEGSGLPHPAHLPTDLSSDSGSLCLSLPDPWDDETSLLPEPFLLDGLLGTKATGLDPWAPSLSLWAPEPSREAGPGEEAPSCCAEETGSEAIPRLHMVPAAWRGPDLQAPTDEASLGDASPEPPDLEREHYDRGLPGNASLLPLHTRDLEMLGAKLEMRDLCFLGPCEDLTGLLSSSLLEFKATANSQGPGSHRAQGAAGAAQAGSRELLAQSRGASYKCRVCFQRFRTLGELDLHKLAHSPCPPPTCYMCVERRFCSRERLQEHLQEKHLQGKAGPWACGMCLKEVADVWMFNQHLREHAARFARRGQAQPESTHTHSLDSTVALGRPHSHRHTADRAGGSARETSEGEREPERDTPRDGAQPKVQALSLSLDHTKAHRGLPSCSSPAAPTSSSATCSTNVPPSLAPDPWPQGEPLLQAVPVHAACRDPSRDCHHCGKRFPKPFKLQRHLVVHSPQRIYLCPQCPGVYPEPQALRAHLGRVHGERAEQELPHTPLYACELCANVLHVIRRSFICSSCNYTFAKKEQFDRHMDKHLRGGQQPFALRSVRRPRTPRQKAPALEGVLPNKRRKVAMPSSPPMAGVAVAGPLSLGNPTLSKGSPPALPHLCPEVAPSTSEGWPDPASPPVREDKLPPLVLSPFPTALANGRGDQRLDPTLEGPEDKAQPGEQQASLGGRRAPPPFSGRHRSRGARSKCASDGSPGDPSQLQKERPLSTPHMAPEKDTRDPSHKGGTTKPPKHRAAVVTPSKAPKLPVQPRRPVGVESPAPRELTHSSEGRAKSTSPKAKPRAGSQGSRGPCTGTKTGGGSQPQPASGRLQSETATTPAGPAHPGPNPTSDKPPSRTQARGCTKGPTEAEDQGSRDLPGPREMGENREKRRRGQATDLTPSEGVGSSGRAPPAPDKPLRTPRKQATPSRVLPAKPRPGSQDGKMRPQPPEQPEGHSHAHRRGALGRHSPQARPLLRCPKRGRAVERVEATELWDHRTAESQSNLLSQLFGQRLTGFKIPLKKCTSE